MNIKNILRSPVFSLPATLGYLAYLAAWALLPRFAEQPPRFLEWAGIALLATLAKTIIAGTVNIIQSRHRYKGQEIILLHKPTGKVIVMPARYESGAIDKFLKDIKGLPHLSSPEYEIVRQAQQPAIPA